jgi:hypothetical protein
MILYDRNKTNIDHTLNEFNKLQQTINFTIEKEQHESISFIDVGMHQNDKDLQFSMCRKPTQTDNIIPKRSCHPYEHKLSDIDYLLRRLHTYTIMEGAKDTKKNHH